MPACSMVIGNPGWGEELSHSLKSECGSWTCNCSTSLSSSGIHERDRWQLARKTQWPSRRNEQCFKQTYIVVHVSVTFSFWVNNRRKDIFVPFLTPSSIMLLAIGACPWPRESAWKCLLMSQVSANCSRAAVGSTPGERTKIRGVLQVDSSTTWGEEGKKKYKEEFVFSVEQKRQPSSSRKYKVHVSCHLLLSCQGQEAPQSEGPSS